jgi:hypothetical protein
MADRRTLQEQFDRFLPSHEDSSAMAFVLAVARARVAVTEQRGEDSHDALGYLTIIRGRLDGKTIGTNEQEDEAYAETLGWYFGEYLDSLAASASAA